MNRINKTEERRKFLERLLLSIGGVSFMPSMVKGAKKKPQTLALDGLRYKAAAKNMLFGAATAEDRLISDAAYRNAIIQECGIITPEYEMKWDRLRPTSTTYNFNDADYILNFAKQNGMALHGHTLCWHRSLPSWFSSTVNASNAASYLTSHIQNVAGRYRGQIYAWDVVNEAIEPRDRKSNYLRNSVWYQYLGEDYIALAFRTAAQADPTALLVYNDYGVEFDDPTRREGVLNLLRRLKTAGVPVHALGIQGHLSYASLLNDFQPTEFAKFLQDVAALGLKIFITEFDCDDTTLPTDIEQRDTGVAKVYGDYAGIIFNQPAVTCIQTWGLTDKYSALQATNKRADGQAKRPLLLDSTFTRKKSWYSWDWWFSNTSKRPATTAVKVTNDGFGVQIYPNPASQRATITVQLTNTKTIQVLISELGGKLVFQTQSVEFTMGIHEFIWDCSGETIGVYFCTIIVDSHQTVEKILVER